MEISLKFKLFRFIIRLLPIWVKQTLSRAHRRAIRVIFVAENLRNDIENETGITDLR